MKTEIKLALLAGILAAAFGAGWQICDVRWQNKWAERDKADLQTAAQAAQEVRMAEQLSSAAVAAIDQIQYKEMQNAQAEINALRADLAAGRRRLQYCRPTPNHAAAPIGAPAGLGEQRNTEQGAGGGGIEPHILAVGEHALTAIAQRDACVAAYNQTRELLAE